MGILQARIREQVAIPSSRGTSRPRNQTGVSCIAGRFFTSWTAREAQICCCLANSSFAFWTFWNFFFFFGGGWPHLAACGILVLQPGIKPTPPAVGAQSLNHWPAREVPIFLSVFDPRLVFSTDAEHVDAELTDTEVQLHSQMSVDRTEVQRTSNGGSLTVPRDCNHVWWNEGFQRGANGKEPTCQCRRQEMWVQFQCGLERSPGGGHSNPLQYSCLDKPMDRGVRQAMVHKESGHKESGTTEAT